MNRADFPALPLVDAAPAESPGAFRADELLGLPFQFHTIYGTLRDGDGEIYTLTRRVTRIDGGPLRLILQTTLTGLPHLKLHDAGRGTSRARGCSRDVVDDALKIGSAPDSDGRSFLIQRGSDRLEWREEGIVSLKGRAVGPELKWYLPRPARRFLYLSQFYFVSGTILGNDVRGFICFDDTFMPDEEPTEEKRHPWNPLINDGLGLAIFNWANHYPDGSCEAGLFAIGRQRFGVGLYANDAGDVTATTDIEGDITMGPEDNRPARIAFRLKERRSLEDSDWEFLPDARGTMPNLASSAQELEGHMHRLGDTRVPDVWFSWGQHFPGNAAKSG